MDSSNLNQLIATIGTIIVAYLTYKGIVDANKKKETRNKIEKEYTDKIKKEAIKDKTEQEIKAELKEAKEKINQEVKKRLIDINKNTQKPKLKIRKWILIISGSIAIFIMLFIITSLITQAIIDCNNEISEIILYLKQGPVFITELEKGITIKREDIVANLQGKLIFKQAVPEACLCTSEVQIDNANWIKINSNIKNDFSFNELTTNTKLITLKFQMKNMTDKYFVIKIIK